MDLQLKAAESEKQTNQKVLADKEQPIALAVLVGLGRGTESHQVALIEPALMAAQLVALMAADVACPRSSWCQNHRRFQLLHYGVLSAASRQPCLVSTPR